MSGARLRGRNRGQRGAPQTPADTEPPAPNPSTRGRVAPFDGPASRGSNSAAGSQGRSRTNSNAGQTAQPATAITRDPAREGTGPLLTDSIRNVDMPASFYAINGVVSHDPF